jgi:hypothetical protein
MSQTTPGFWRALHQKMLAALEDGQFMRLSGYTVPGRTFNFRSIQDFLKTLDWVAQKADLEEGILPYRGRTYAGNRGRG